MKKIIALSALMAVLASANAFAVDANLTFNGSVTSGTCTMVATDASKTLTIPDISAAALLADTGAWSTQSTSSNITFNSCPGSITKIRATSITSTGQVVATNKVAALPATGVSTNVAVGLFVGGGGWNLVDGSNIGDVGTVTNGTAVIPIKTAVMALKNVGGQSSQPAPAAGNYSNAYTVTFSWS